MLEVKPFIKETKMERITELIQEHRQAKMRLREVEHSLSRKIFQLPEEVLEAVNSGVVSFNFPVPRHIKEDLKNGVR